jgi:hypothetical protein
MGVQDKPRRSQRRSQPTRRGTLGQALGNSGKATPRSAGRQRRVPRKAAGTVRTSNVRSAQPSRPAAGRATAPLPIIEENRQLDAANYDLPAPPAQQEYAVQQLPVGFIPRKVGETVGAVVNGIHDLGTILEVRLLAGGSRPGRQGHSRRAATATIEAQHLGHEACQGPVDAGTQEGTGGFGCAGRGVERHQHEGAAQASSRIQQCLSRMMRRMSCT